MIPYKRTLEVKTEDDLRKVMNDLLIIESHGLKPASFFKTQFRLGKAHLYGAFITQYDKHTKIATYSYDYMLDVLHEFTWNNYNLSRREFKEVINEYDEDEINNYLRSMITRFHKNNIKSNRRIIKVIKNVSKKYNSNTFLELKETYLKLIGE